jgi:hypothetical protein
MNSKERVNIALRRTGLPDRVPIQFDLSQHKLEEFSQIYGIPVHYTQAYYEDVTYRLSGNELRLAMGSDCVVVGASLPRGYQHAVDEKGHTINEFGMRLQQGSLYMELIGYPLADVTTRWDIEAYNFPNITLMGLWRRFWGSGLMQALRSSIPSSLAYQVTNQRISNASLVIASRFGAALTSRSYSPSEPLKKFGLKYGGGSTSLGRAVDT